MIFGYDPGSVSFTVGGYAVRGLYLGEFDVESYERTRRRHEAPHRLGRMGAVSTLASLDVGRFFVGGES